jgi:hypothetical protein
MKHALRLGLVPFILLALLALSGQAAAQTPPPTDLWTHGTTLSGVVGVAAASSRSGAMAGGAVGWEVTPSFGVDGTAAWFDRPGASESFTAALGVHANLLTSGRLLPFVKGSFGLYRASFDMARDDTDMPDFYRRRLGVSNGAVGAPRTFTDPSFAAGGGIEVFTMRHWAVRPQIEAIVVRRDSRSHVVTALTLQIAYHFENHPGRPARD